MHAALDCERREKRWIGMDNLFKPISLPQAGERRKFERVALQLALQFCSESHPEEVVDCVTENISGEGVYFVSAHTLTKGERLEVDMCFPPHNSGRNNVNLHLRCRVQVVRVDPGSQGLGFGIACRIENYTLRFGEADLRHDRIYQSAKA